MLRAWARWVNLAAMKKGEWSDMAVPGAEISCRVTPRAGREDIRREDGVAQVRVTAAPENGKANKAVAKLLAKALGVAPSRLVLIRGETSRDKVFRVSGP